MSALKDAVTKATREETRTKAEKAGKDPDLAELEALAAKAYAAGHDFRIEDGRLITGESPTPHTVSLDLGKEHFKLAIVSDTHLGSRYEQLSALRSFYHVATEEGVDLAIHGGDMHDGADAMHRGRIYEVHAHGAAAQVSYASQVYPRAPFPTYYIDGNHDWSFTADAGVNVGRQLALLRPDLHYVGSTAAYFSVGSLKTFVIHPSGGKPYADSYRMQKIAESLPIGNPVNLLLVGHLHIYCKDEMHGMIGFQIPCFQRQYPYLAGKGLHPALGGIIVEVWMTERGEIARLKEERVRYQAVEDDDFDQEVSREVARGWSAKGLAL